MQRCRALKAMKNNYKNFISSYKMNKLNYLGVLANSRVRQ